MASIAATNMLCTDLGFPPASVDENIRAFLQTKLDAAAAELSAAGIEIDESDASDMDLLVMYAAWLYRDRLTQSEKPLMLQRLIRNRQTSQIVGGAS